MARRLVSFLTCALVLWPAVDAADAQAGKAHFLWRVQDRAGAVAYLVGSLHVLTRQHYPLGPAFEEAFAASKVLVEEIDLDEMRSPLQVVALAARAMFTDGRTLDRVVSADTYDDVRRRAERARVPMLVIQRMKPWMAAVALTVPLLQAAGFEPELGLDRHFLERAKTRGMERRALESATYQLDRFDGLPAPLQERLLKATLVDLDTQVANVSAIAGAWAAGDTATIERLLLAAMIESPELYDRLLVERNRNWMAPVEACVSADARCFVVVGAAHLVGPDGLPAMLRKKGYRVEQQ